MKLINYLKGAVLLGALAAGCSYNGRTGLEFSGYKCNLSKKIQTTAVHPDDRDFLSGKTTAKIDEGRDISPILGLESKLKKGKVRWKAGADLRLFSGSSSDGEYKKGMYAHKQQESDNRPDESGSMVYSQLTSKPVGFRPFVGVEIGEGWKFGLEAGLAYQGFRFESGHDRYSKWSAVREDEWSGFGPSIVGYGGFEEGRHSFVMSAGYERFEPEFCGEKNKIEKTTFGLIYRFKF
jgi:hypothetical protein